MTNQARLQEALSAAHASAERLARETLDSAKLALEEASREILDAARADLQDRAQVAAEAAAKPAAEIAARAVTEQLAQVALAALNEDAARLRTDVGQASVTAAQQVAREGLFAFHSPHRLSALKAMLTIVARGGRIPRANMSWITRGAGEQFNFRTEADCHFQVDGEYAGSGREFAIGVSELPLKIWLPLQ